ncbi:ethanolamine ammonia-lyase subunit EutC [Acetobacter oeni]|uniref:Ethanolamine ammonia-lyase small subunit n=1 Tax=Acetobacter oeni TaxID=304077 RepID=A0A511XKB1_9PROT|nr:ethanolamine ammonia-lyase subunit EutC [Acetobacter oeni]MBB3883875.1 ethanolamine ammonia-lyase small subunit [Acetobacter oeni]NHO19799.1 ethanolamine ammonia-lyase subunit EutC [Acetobacter oeni]GBR03501.1 ethanolamine ammonia-lyase small subunit [Acetobacter oeni LMG 21952]GEN63372.1 ethanolamine ammonia-lyase light chain [Acetobacter oeni]
MTESVPDSVSADPWKRLRNLTRARIGLTRAGDTLSGAEVRAQQAAHARARRAVHACLNPSGLAMSIDSSTAEVIEVRSEAADRAAFVRRPDLGRLLAPQSAVLLRGLPGPVNGYDIVFVAADGLSAIAVEHQVPPLLKAAISSLSNNWRIAPLVIAHNARVALGDEIGFLINAGCVVMMIGERPGLSVSDSLSLYITWLPRPGRQDSERNCISNIHENGLSIQGACHKLCWLLSAARKLGGTGIRLKDESTTLTALPRRESESWESEP